MGDVGVDDGGDVGDGYFQINLDAVVIGGGRLCWYHIDGWL